MILPTIVQSVLRFLKYRRWTLLSLLLIIPLGFGSKFYSGPAEVWVNDSLGGLFYEIFWCVFILLLVKGGKPRIIAASVLTVTCVLEFLQLSHHPALEWIRSCFIGRALVGTHFVWSDFPYYFIGCGIGWLWMKRLVKWEKRLSF